MNIIIASIPRCGSTYMFRKLAGLASGDFFPRSYAGPMIKTHKLPSEFVGLGKRAIFLFGDPITAVLSTMARRNDVRHFRNCGCNRQPHEVNLAERDWLGYERIFDAWMAQDVGIERLLVRYETIPSYDLWINEWLGREIDFSDFRTRTTSTEQFDPCIVAQVEETYASLIKKVDDACDLEMGE